MSVDSLYETMGLVRIVEMNPEGRSRLEYEAKPGMCHSGGVVQGGFVTGWIDAAMAHAVIAMMGDGITPMSLELKVSFFAPVRPGLVVAEGWIERRGSKTAFLEGGYLIPRAMSWPRARRQPPCLTAPGWKPPPRPQPEHRHDRDPPLHAGSPRSPA